MSQATGKAVQDDAAIEFIGVMFRITALLLDQILVMALAVAVSAALLGTNIENPDLPLAAVTIILLPLHVLWHVGFWRWRGATPGNWLLSTRIVIFRTGRRPGVGRCLVRYLGGWLCLATLGTGFFWLLRDPWRRALHDRLAGTALVGDESLRAPSRDERRESSYRITEPPWSHG